MRYTNILEGNNFFGNNNKNLAEACKTGGIYDFETQFPTGIFCFNSVPWVRLNKRHSPTGFSMNPLPIRFLTNFSPPNFSPVPDPDFWELSNLSNRPSCPKRIGFGQACESKLVRQILAMLFSK
jgi:hypothetical protein